MTINDEKLQKIENMRSSLLKKFHQIFLFLSRNEKDYEDPNEDPAMKKINKHAMTKFSDALDAWKTRVKARIIDKKEPYSEIVKDIPTITEEQFQIFKEACEAEAAKNKSKYMKGLQRGTLRATTSEAVVTAERGPNGPRRTRKPRVLASQTPWWISPSRRSMTSSGPGTVGTQ